MRDLRSLRPGWIFEIALAAGIDVRQRGEKAPIRCPFHDDHNASAFLSTRNIFFCSVCTPNGGWTAKRFAQVLGVPSSGSSPRQQCNSSARSTAGPPAFATDEAQRVWRRAMRRALDEVHADQDAASYAFVQQRRLDRAWRSGLLGFLGPDAGLRTKSGSWFELGVRLVAPLHDLRGRIANLQGRNVLDREPRLLFPTGSRARGTVFANAAGLVVLRGEGSERACLLAEGLTDFLALATVPELAVLSAPGASMVRHLIGPWVQGIDLVLAFDGDRAGELARQVAAQRARAAGVRRLRTIRWPCGAKDACEVLDRIGVDGLDLFLAQHIMESPRV